MKTFTHNGTPIRYRDEGEGMVTLLFIHGLYADQTYWDSQLAYFSRHYRVITVDLPGHGESGRDRTHWSIRTLAEDVKALLHDLSLTNVIIIAHSLGCEVALAATAGRPGAVLGFIAVDAFKSAGQPMPDKYAPFIEELRQDLTTDPAGANERYVRTALITGDTPAAVTDRVVQSWRGADANMAGQMLPDALEAYKPEAMLLPKLDKKLYLVNVDYIPTDEQALGQYLNAGYELAQMPGTSHYPMLENPEELNRLLDIAIEHIGEPEMMPHGL